MKAEILSVGTEMLLGEITDTNATFLAQDLVNLGVDLFFVSQIGDNFGRLSFLLKQAWERSNLIITTGGIGPTEDDLTREGVAALLGEEMTVDPDSAEHLRAFWRGRGQEMPERNLKQATLIPSATQLPNPLGTAPGWFVERDGKIIISMPGVPREMYRMWEDEAVPRLRQHLPGALIVTRTLKVIGIGESAVEEMLGELVRSGNPSTATYAKNDGVHVRIAAKSTVPGEAERLVAEREATCRAILGDAIYGIDRETLPDAVMQQLDQQGLTLAVVEAGTGGSLFNTLTGSQSPGLLGGLTLQRPTSLNLADEVLRMEVHDLATAAGATILATKARDIFGAAVGMGITVAPSPGAGQPGTIYFAIDVRGRVTEEERRFRATPAELRRRAALFGAEILRAQLLAPAATT
ncbi:MAG: CinA family nicotinamide mononucleotide deamidase-related protein [Chloroflexi bacterium]|nr:CinA family nicotinamide mononucleotide deamidase-related protein [Chloroflexota bacterium]